MNPAAKLGLIVEGQGDAKAAPLLVKKILQELKPGFVLQIEEPFRVKRHQVVKEEEFRRAMEFMSRKVGNQGRVLMLLDADDDLPCELGPRLRGWARKHHGHVKVEVAIARRTFEAWFIASAMSLRGKCGLPKDLLPEADPDAVSSPKGWMKERLKVGGGSYKETVDQATLADEISVSEARRSKSFNKLCIKLGRLFDLPVPPRELSR